MRSIAFIFALCAPLFIFSQSKTIKDGNSLVAAMHKKYAGKWYKNFTFIQDIIFYKDSQEVKREKWYEALSFPGNLVIKFNDMNSDDGVIFSDRKVTSIKDGKALEPKPFIHDLLLAGFDVYFLKPTETSHLLDSLGYKMNVLHEDTFSGRKVYVVGAEKGDDQSNQFWVDAERLYLHRIIYKKGKSVQDVVFGDYILMNKYWVATSVSFKRDGKLEAIEKYYDIKFPDKLDSEIFQPTKFLDSKW
jgi:hypothetical protein